MMIVDARGLLCPEPVVRTQRAVKDGLSELTVLVDAEPAQFGDVADFGRQRCQLVAVEVEVPEQGQAGDGGIDPGDLIVVEIEVTQARQLCHAGRDLGQLILAQIEVDILLIVLAQQRAHAVLILVVQPAEELLNRATRRFRIRAAAA